MIYIVIIGVTLLLLTPRAYGGYVDYDLLFKKYADQYGLDWKMLKAIAIIESALGLHPTVMRGLTNPKDIEGSKSDDGKSWGLMQVTIPTARDYDASATAEKLNNPEYSVKIAAKHIAYLQKYFAKYKDKPEFTEYVIKSYNQGQGNTNKEIAGTISGYADGYWLKYKAAYGTIIDF